MEAVKCADHIEHHNLNKVCNALVIACYNFDMSPSAVVGCRFRTGKSIFLP